MGDEPTVVAPSVARVRVTRPPGPPIDWPLFAWPQELSIGRPGMRCAIVVDEPLLAAGALHLGWDGQRLTVRGSGPVQGRIIGPDAPLRLGDTAIALEPTAAPAVEPRIYRPPRQLASPEEQTRPCPAGDALIPSVDLLGRLTLRNVWISLARLRGRKLALTVGVLMILAGVEAGYLLSHRRVATPPLAPFPMSTRSAIVIPRVDRFAKRSTEAVLKAAVEAVEAGRTSEAIDAFETLALLDNDQGARFMVWLLTHPDVRQRR